MFNDRVISDIPFHNAELAHLHWDELAAQISLPLASALPGLLKESPDPDAALLMLERLVIESGQEVVQLLNRYPPLLHYAVLVFGYSRFLGETLLRNTDLLHSLANRRSLDQSYSHEEFCEALK